MNTLTSVTIYNNHEDHIHATGCADIAKSIANGKGEIYGTFNNVREAVEDIYGEVAADQGDYDTPEWEEALQFEAGRIEVKPCVPAELRSYQLTK